MAVGPGADYYAPRFLEFERIGHSLPSWNWASLWAPSAWAFYRRLWLPGIVFAIWPLAAVALFQWVDPYLGDSRLPSVMCAALLIWLIPGVVAALLADTLVFRRARRQVRDAEAKTMWPEDAARMLAGRAPIAPVSAVSMGGMAIILAFYVATPSLQMAYADRLVRTHVTQVLSAIDPIKLQIEQWWTRSSTDRVPPDYQAIAKKRGAQFLEGVDVSLANGRVRLALGPLIPELSGRSILLAPTVDPQQQVRWICVPVGIPTRYLPQECREG